MEEERESCWLIFCRLFCAFLLHGSYCIAAIVIGFMEQCNNEGYPEITAPNMYLIIGGFVGIVDGLCISSWKYDLKQR